MNSNNNKVLTLLHQKRPASIQRHKPAHLSNFLTYLAGFTIVTLRTLIKPQKGAKFTKSEMER